MTEGVAQSLHPATTQADDRLIVALDLPAVADAEKLIGKLGSAVSFYKIGYQLAFAGGLELARDLRADGKHVFLDMKLLDIDADGDLDILTCEERDNLGVIWYENPLAARDS